MNLQLYEGKKFTSWSIKRVAEALSNEWKLLGSTFQAGAETAYSYKTNRISFKGEVNVTLDISRDKYPDKNSVEITVLLSLSPDPNDLSLHVLNTLNLGMFLDTPELAGKKIFSIKKDESWNGSVMQTAAQFGSHIIEAMLKFESCFHLLLDDEHQVSGVKLNSKSMSITHHLNQVKAYRLAEIYGHPEKLDEAIEAIKSFALIDDLTRQRLEGLRSRKPQDAANWLYTSEFLERLCK